MTRLAQSGQLPATKWSTDWREASLTEYAQFEDVKSTGRFRRPHDSGRVLEVGAEEVAP
jgi:hypothetical protein